MAEPTSRYRRTKQRREAIEKHNEIVGRLGYDVRQDFDRRMEELTEPTPCIAGGLPSKWTDWDSVEENREPYETDQPSKQAARLMCEPCPLFGTSVCLSAALARGETHGVWEGTIIENGKVVS